MQIVGEIPLADLNPYNLDKVTKLQNFLAPSGSLQILFVLRKAAGAMGMVESFKAWKSLLPV